MKRILALGLAIGILATSFAQSGPIRKATEVTNANATTAYATYSATPSKVKAFQATVVKNSGTVAGALYLEATVDGSSWVQISNDTLALTNTATQTKVWTISGTSYHSYRCKFVTTGTQNSTLTFTYVRRLDD